MNRPAAVSTALHDLLHGGPVGVRVIAAFPRAAYVEAERSDVEVAGARRCADVTVFSVVASDGLPHPNSVVLAGRPTDGIPPAWRVGTTGHAGQGRLQLGGTRLIVTRWWEPRPTLGVIGTVSLAGRLAELERVLRPHLATEPLGLVARAAAVVDALAADDVDAAVGAGRGLVGLGPGLTPSGDDVLCGLFASVLLLGDALRQHGERVEARGGGSEGGHIPSRIPNGRGRASPGAATIRAAAARLAAFADDRTPAPSAALLWHAGRGQATGPLARLLQQMTRWPARHGDRSVEPYARALLQVGSTSGRDLAIGSCAGTRLALHLAGHRSSRPLPPSRDVPHRRPVPSGSRTS